ncbi:UPF0481 protein At3g47200-like [Hordeum vulgare subsp. vulgare]|uniref:Uncharacterized protein n=1 Tax=Hordeum vulgare subsp. vulgare TaxID=112509 RepID=M0X7A5_HORVV|nr:UPF0481 protein At3g47200-like [Hordeum vulgare subsp. vulgare]XP_044953560.1 UPF0481 protein At3g47200-like [Hordeum vulgare subsp. vulgare]
MSMEPSSWVVPCDSGWSMEEAAAAWSSDHRISFQTSLPSHSDSGMQLQVVEYAAPPTATATATHDNDCSYPIQVFEEAVQPFRADYLDSMERKMHKFPPSLIDMDGTRYTAPVIVAIGPYHHGNSDVLEAEKMKHVAATQCMRESTRSPQEMYNAVFFVSPDARNLYYQDEEESAKFGDDNFLPMMFVDACFLVQFMRWYDVSEDDMDAALVIYFNANYEHICTDIMMLENQIPWVVVEAILGCMPPAPSPRPWEAFAIAMRRSLKNQADDAKSKMDDTVVARQYEPPHLLGLVWFYIVAKHKKEDLPSGDWPMSYSMTVAELADIGITFKPKKETEVGLVGMGLEKKPPIFRAISVQPLCLTNTNATWLINMAAFELCSTPDFENSYDENSDVCSYLQLFGMLLDQKKHVHDLREKDVIQGGGLTSKDTLEFFTLIGKNMRIGRSYLRLIKEIERFKQKRRISIKMWLFGKKHGRTIAAVISAIGVIIGILSSLQALKPR